MDPYILSDYLDLPPTPTQPDSDMLLDLPSSSASSSSAGAAPSWPPPTDGWADDDGNRGFAFGRESEGEGELWCPGSLDGVGIELGEIAPLPNFPPPSTALFPSFYPHHPAPQPTDFLPSASRAGNPAATALDADYHHHLQQQQQQQPFESADHPSPAPSSSAGSSSNVSTLAPPTPPPPASLLASLAPAHSSISTKRARSAESDDDDGRSTSTLGGGVVAPASLTLSSPSTFPAPPSTTSSSSSSHTDPPPLPPAKRELTGVGKKRKTLPSVADFQAPSTEGLSKKEARLVKNRAAAFLSRQRKRELFDELELEVVQLRAEVGELRKASGGGAGPGGDEVERLKSDLANVRQLLHASTARERSLEVEVASLRALLATTTSAASSSSGVFAADSPASSIPAGSVGSTAGPMLAGFEDRGQGLVGGRRVGRRRADGERDGKRIGGVALMVIMFSFALFSFPSTTLSSLPRLVPTSTGSGGGSNAHGSPFPAFLGRVLQASSSSATSASSAAGGGGSKDSKEKRFASLTLAKDDGRGGGPVCTLGDKLRLLRPGSSSSSASSAAERPAAADGSGVGAGGGLAGNGTLGSDGVEPMECDAPALDTPTPLSGAAASDQKGSERTVKLDRSTPSSSSAAAAASWVSDLAWPLVQPDPARAAGEHTRRSLSLTFLRPVPASLADRLALSTPATAPTAASTDDDDDDEGLPFMTAQGAGEADRAVDEVLARWLGFAIDDGPSGWRHDASSAESFGGNGGADSIALGGVEGSPAEDAAGRAGGWLLIGPGPSATDDAGARTEGLKDVQAWDGTTLEPLELDNVLVDDGRSALLHTSAVVDPLDAPFPSPAADDDEEDERSTELYRVSPTGVQYPHLYAMSSPPPTSSSPLPNPASHHTANPNATAAAAAAGPAELAEHYLRFDLSLDLALRRTSAGVVGKDEVGRLIGRSVGGRAEQGERGGLGGLLGLGLEGLM